MTLTTPSTLPAALGGAPAFSGGLPLTRVHLPDLQGLRRRLESILYSGQLTNGRTVRELEEAVAQVLGVPHVVAVSSCTSGLLLVLQALRTTGSCAGVPCAVGVGRTGSNAAGPVVLPSFTFAATAHAVAWSGGTPVFADIDAATLTLDPDHAEDTATRLPGAVALMATHVYGTPCAVERLQEVADHAGIPIVYDAAHALGSRRRGKPIGGFGTAEVFSLSPTKVAVAGEGGLVATADAGLAEACRLGRDYGNPGDYDCLFPGLNARMSELHAAVALGSLAALDERVAHRNMLVQRFAGAMEGLPGIRLPSVEPGDVSTYKDLTLIVDPGEYGMDVPALAAALRSEGVDSRRYFFPPVHRQRAYAHLGLPADLPVTDTVAPRVLTLPLWSHMSEEQVLRLADTVVLLHAWATDVRQAVHPPVR